MMMMMIREGIQGICKHEFGVAVWLSCLLKEIWFIVKFVTGYFCRYGLSAIYDKLN
jgi:hypothetical protein